ncbi:MAG: hypothetical protein Q9202_005808 [Teloschistes flavicans]
MFGRDTITRLILATSLPGFLVTCHRASLRAREYGYWEPSDNDTSLVKRTIWDLTDMTGGDKSVVIDAFADMSAVVNEVVNHPNPSVLQNYFDPGDADDVASVFRTVQAMIQPGGVPNAPNPGFGPTNLNQIRIRREGLFSGCSAGLLAYSSGVASLTPTREIVICDFGWTVLYKRLRRDLQCANIGPKINYKMQFLGPLLLHETLHFNNVGNMAWGSILGPGEAIDDQPVSWKRAGWRLHLTQVERHSYGLPKDFYRRSGVLVVLDVMKFETG